jgi:hypothetical protein
MATVIRQREEAECERERDKERVREAGTSAEGSVVVEEGRSGKEGVDGG